MKKINSILLLLYVHEPKLLEMMVDEILKIVHISLLLDAWHIYEYYDDDN